MRSVCFILFATLALNSCKTLSKPAAQMSGICSNIATAVTIEEAIDTMNLIYNCSGEAPACTDNKKFANFETVINDMTDLFMKDGPDWDENELRGKVEMLEVDAKHPANAPPGKGLVSLKFEPNGGFTRIIAEYASCTGETRQHS